MTVEQTQTSFVAKERTGTGPRTVLTWAAAQVKKRYQQLKNRYGPRYTYAMVLVVFVALFSPVPGSTLIAVAAVALIAEIHRALGQKGMLSGAAAILAARLRQPRTVGRDRARPALYPEFEPVHGWTKRQRDGYLARNPAYRSIYEAELNRRLRTASGAAFSVLSEREEPR